MVKASKLKGTTGPCNADVYELIKRKNKMSDSPGRHSGRVPYTRSAIGIGIIDTYCGDNLKLHMVRQAVIGRWQRVLCGEMDGPRTRTIRAQVQGISG